MHQCFSSQFRVTQKSETTLIEGCPSGVSVTPQNILSGLKRFFTSYDPKAAEKLALDQIQITAGVENNKTTGEAISVLLKDCPDATHVYVQHAVANIIAGVVAQNYLGTSTQMRGALVQLGEHIVDRSEWSWSEVKNNALFSPNVKAATFWQHFLDTVGEAGQTVGAVIELQATGVPVGLSGGACATLDSEIARSLMSIVGAKGVEMGAGFALAALTGKLCKDQQEESTDGVVRFKTNKAGGVMNGLSTGQDIVVRFAVQPALHEEGEGKLSHACIGISAVPVGEALLACVIASAKLQKEMSADLAAAS